MQSFQYMDVYKKTTAYDHCRSNNQMQLCNPGFSCRCMVTGLMLIGPTPWRAFHVELSRVMSDYTLSARRPSECIFTSSRSGEQTHFPVKTRRATFRSWPTLNANAMQRYNNFPIKRNSLAENRVSLSIFNYHTWIEYENYTHIVVFNNICTPFILY